MSRALPTDLPLGLHLEPARKLIVPLDHGLHCRMILCSTFTKYNIRKLNLLPKTDLLPAAISKGISINSSNK